ARLAGFARWLKLVARVPADGAWLRSRLPSQREAEAGHLGVAGEVHLRAVFVGRLVIAMGGVVFGLLVAPLPGTPLKLPSFVDREGRYTHPCQAEMIGTVVVASLREGIGTYG